MVLRRPGGVSQAMQLISWRPQVDLHARFNLRVQAGAPALPLPPTLHASALFAPVLRSRAGVASVPSGPGAAITAQRRPGHPDARVVPLVFAAAPGVITPFAPALPARTPSRPAPAPMQLRCAAGRARELAARVRRNGMRDELRLAPKPAVLAVAPRTAAPPAPGRPDDIAPLQPAGIWPADNRAPPAAAAMNVEALTGLVIQQIDRRLIAYRERMGRT
jgi:hypothetical protein